MFSKKCLENQWNIGWTQIKIWTFAMVNAIRKINKKHLLVSLRPMPTSMAGLENCCEFLRTVSLFNDWFELIGFYFISMAFVLEVGRFC